MVLCDEDLVSLIWIRKREKHPQRSVTFKSATLLKVWCFASFLNCTNGTKSREASQMICHQKTHQKLYWNEKLKLLNIWRPKQTLSVYNIIARGDKFKEKGERLRSFQPSNFLKKKLRYRYFLVNHAKFLKEPLFKELVRAVTSEYLRKMQLLAGISPSPKCFKE